MEVPETNGMTYRQSRGEQKASFGTSLVVQWLRLCPPSEGGSGSIPGREARPCMPQLRPGKAK